VTEIEKRIGLKNNIFADLFAGTGIIGKKVKNEVNQVIANDLEKYAYVLNKNNLLQRYDNLKEKKEIIDYLNNIKPRDDGLIYNYYCSPADRKYFSDENGKKIDAIRMEIEKYKNDEELYYFLLATLIESADKVANTASVYASFLKKLKKTAKQPLKLMFEIENEFLFGSVNNRNHKVYNEDANELIKKISGNILYLDPPYNERQYGAYYHILNTIAEYKPFNPKGITGQREYNRSKWCIKKEAGNQLFELLNNANFEWIFLSYNNEGLMSEEEIKKIMSEFGKYELVKKEYQRYKADKNREYKNDKTYEYLHILQKK
jgi:adenine-specific DNA-methyltransferase